MPFIPLFSNYLGHISYFDGVRSESFDNDILFFHYLFTEMLESSNFQQTFLEVLFNSARYVIHYSVEVPSILND